MQIVSKILNIVLLTTKFFNAHVRFFNVHTNDSWNKIFKYFIEFTLSTAENILKVWQNLKLTYSTMIQMTKNVLFISVFDVKVERLFFMTRNVITYRRNRFQDSTIENIMIIKRIEYFAKNVINVDTKLLLVSINVMKQILNDELSEKVMQFITFWIENDYAFDDHYSFDSDLNSFDDVNSMFSNDDFENDVSIFNQFFISVQLNASLKRKRFENVLINNSAVTIFHKQVSSLSDQISSTKTIFVFSRILQTAVLFFITRSFVSSTTRLSNHDRFSFRRIIMTSRSSLSITQFDLSLFCSFEFLEIVFQFINETRVKLDYVLKRKREIKRQRIYTWKNESSNISITRNFIFIVALIITL